MSANPNFNLTGMTVKAAADQLARRAAIVSLIKAAGLMDSLKGFGASAAGKKLQGYGQQAADAWKANPTAVGGLAGAALGGLGGAALGEYNRSDDPDAPSPWSTGLTGALAGGALGAGVSSMIPAAKSIATTSPEVTEQQSMQKVLEGMQPDATQAMLASHLPASLSSLALAHPLTAVGTLFSSLRGLKNHLQRSNAAPANAANITDPKILRGLLESEGAAARLNVPTETPGKVTPASSKVEYDPRTGRIVSESHTAATKSPSSFAYDDMATKNMATRRPEQLAGDMRFRFRDDPDRAGTFNTALEEYLRNMGRQVKDKNPGMVYSATGPSSFVPRSLQRNWRGMLPDWLPRAVKSRIPNLKNLEQGAIEAEERGEGGTAGKVLGYALPTALGYVGDTLLPEAYHAIRGQPLYGLGENAGPDVVARLQQYAKSHPEFLQAARDSGKYIPSAAHS